MAAWVEDGFDPSSVRRRRRFEVWFLTLVTAIDEDSLLGEITCSDVKDNCSLSRNRPLEVRRAMRRGGGGYECSCSKKDPGRGMVGACGEADRRLFFEGHPRFNGWMRVFGEGVDSEDDLFLGFDQSLGVSSSSETVFDFRFDMMCTKI